MKWQTALCVALLGACSAPDQELAPASQPAAPELAPASQPADPAIVELETALAEQLATEPVRRTDLRRTIRLPANVKLDRMQMSLIGSGVRGRIVEVHVQRGTLVEAGTPLAVLTSPEYTRRQVDFLGALAEMELQQRAVERAEKLVDAEVISRAELELRRSRLFLASTEVKSHRSQLELMGMAPNEIDTIKRSKTILTEVTIYSRTVGTVIERNVSREQVVEAGEQMFIIGDLSRVRVEGEAPASEVHFLGTADHLLVEIPSLGGERIKGDLLHVAATADRTTRTVTVRTEIDNPGGTIKPEMLAILEVVGPAEMSLVVSAAAIVREGNQDYVFVQEGDGRYRFVEVEVKPEMDGVRAVSRGLREDDLVVVDGASRINSERKQKAADR